MPAPTLLRESVERVPIKQSDLLQHAVSTFSSPLGVPGNGNLRPQDQAKLHHSQRHVCSKLTRAGRWSLYCRCARKRTAQEDFLRQILRLLVILHHPEQRAVYGIPQSSKTLITFCLRAELFGRVNEFDIERQPFGSSIAVSHGYPTNSARNSLERISPLKWVDGR